MPLDSENNWQFIHQIARVETQWFSLIGENWRAERNVQIEYWRVEKVDSVIILPIWRSELLSAKPTFRPGINRATIDFPGGHLPGNSIPSGVALSILERELGVKPDAVINLAPLNEAPWPINSAFSNQGLWGFVAVIDDSYPVPDTLIGLRVPANENGVAMLLSKFDCLQCRAILLEWERQYLFNGRGIV
jgi:hypothetical protein